jgi:metal-responsive CopG/Arc/MetJ family transcriptional regulator
MYGITYVSMARRRSGSSKAAIVQVPVDAEFLSRVDETAGLVSESRAEFMREACRQRLKRIEEKELERRYVEGYRRVPEKDAWGKTAAKLLSRIISDDESR